MTSDDGRIPMQATPKGTLLERLMNPNFAKSELEHFAAAEIARLTAAGDKMQEELLSLAEAAKEGERKILDLTSALAEAEKRGWNEAIEKAAWEVEIAGWHRTSDDIVPWESQEAQVTYVAAAIRAMVKP